MLGQDPLSSPTSDAFTSLGGTEIETDQVGYLPGIIEGNDFVADVEQFLECILTVREEETSAGRHVKDSLVDRLSHLEICGIEVDLAPVVEDRQFPVVVERGEKGLIFPEQYLPAGVTVNPQFKGT
jgi:hypothetical protein